MGKIAAILDGLYSVKQKEGTSFLASGDNLFLTELEVQAKLNHFFEKWINQTGCGYSLHNSVTPQQQELVFQINFFQ